MSKNGDKKYLKKLKKSQYLSPELKSIYIDKVEREIEERQEERKKEGEDKITGLLLEREILKIHLKTLLTD
ncbi:hypothetical protein [Flagellimonas sp. CMM7]|uniref:hypothetical protein n=1 Tax=Flagellimonas sp. CMM7 TaxID=2654676 RepID=UPI0013CF6070|nr:hypothetical protein [Flagellimonas sp. CMM7]UII80054.1 hypothetical protein LV704_00685 [Flagellimonas sp. CMM7]